MDYNEPAIDMEHLSVFTDNDPEEEKMFFELFLEQADVCVNRLRGCLTTDDAAEWKSAAHMLKGSAANLGARALAEQCAKAEKGCESDAHVKEHMLEVLSAHMMAVRTFCDARIESHGG